MLEVIKDLALLLILCRCLCDWCVYSESQKSRRFAKLPTDLIQKAEIAITGSGMGAEKESQSNCAVASHGY